MKYFKVILFVGIVPILRSTLHADTLTLTTHVHMDNPVGWDVIKTDNNDVLLKPFGDSGVRLLKFWHYPSDPSEASLPKALDEDIEPQLWKKSWDDSSFWQREAPNHDELKYLTAATNRIFSRTTEWSCTRHTGFEVPDIVNCYTIVPEGALVATYTSNQSGISDDEAQRQRDEVQRILNGISFEK